MARKEESGLTCSMCRRTLEEGMDVMEVEDCVIGFRGVVRLEHARLFCGLECLKKYYKLDRESYPRLPRRFP